MQWLTNFLREWTSLVISVTGMVGAIAGLAQAFRRPVKPINYTIANTPEEGPNKKHIRGRLRREAHRALSKPLGKVSASVLLLSGGILVARTLIQPLSLNAELTRNAFNAYNRGNYVVAITNAQECVDIFFREALRQERELKEAPPIGSVPREKRQEILAHGPLNDVASSLYIIASSYERLKLTNSAMEYYKQATNLLCARTWDPKGWFWSPASASADRLDQLQEKR